MLKRIQTPHVRGFSVLEFSRSLLRNFFMNFFLLILTKIVFVHVHISKLLFILLLIYITTLEIRSHHLVLNTVSSLGVIFSSLKQAEGNLGRWNVGV